MLFRVAFGKKTTAASARKSALFALIITHVQLIIGLVLYFISPLVMFSSASMKNSVLRFYLVEHIGLMIVAIALVTIGYSAGKKASDSAAGARKTFYFFLIGFLLILISIPWPFRNLGAGWF
jgi:membrane protein DedA with SNARE-associated domain